MRAVALSGPVRDFVAEIKPGPTPRPPRLRCPLTHPVPRLLDEAL
jgi:hypothetical protein